jgi:hypothetical protein
MFNTAFGVSASAAHFSERNAARAAAATAHE